MSATDPVLPTPIDASRLPDDPATLQRMIVELLASLQQQQHDNEVLRQRLDRLLRRLYGPRGERYDPQQALLFAELAAGPQPAEALPPEPTPQAQPQRRGRPHGRRRLPPNLPRESRHHCLTEAERLCPDCGQPRVDIGVDPSEQLEYRPASLFVVEHFVHKYVCPACSHRAGAAPAGQGGPEQETMPVPPAEPAQAAEAACLPEASERGAAEATCLPEASAPGAAPAAAEAACLPEASERGAAEAACLPEASAPGAATSPSAPAPPASPPPVWAGEGRGLVIAAAKPAMPIAKGLPGPGLLAHLIVSKYADHLPLYRLERIYERQGVFLPRSTLSDWLAATAQLLKPLHALLVAEVLQSRVLHTDDTPLKMQDPPTHQLSTARLWVYLGDAAHAYNVFDFTVTRKRDGPQQFLARYRGYLQADAFSGYDGLYLPDPATATARIVEVACNAHARRKFYEARTTDSLRAHQALAYYRQLYELERRAQELQFDAAQWLQLRQDLSLPILAKFRHWLEEQRRDVLPKSPLGEAIGYALNNWTALVRYTEAGFLAIDNNVAEREMKRIALGRKNWLFVGSPQGGQTAAILISFTSTCQRLGVEPWAYLQDVLTRLPSLPADQLPDLLPDRWEKVRHASQAPPPSASPTSATDSGR